MLVVARRMAAPRRVKTRMFFGATSPENSERIETSCNLFSPWAELRFASDTLSSQGRSRSSSGLGRQRDAFSVAIRATSFRTKISTFRLSADGWLACRCVTDQRRLHAIVIRRPVLGAVTFCFPGVAAKGPVTPGREQAATRELARMESHG